MQVSFFFPAAPPGCPPSCAVGFWVLGLKTLTSFYGATAKMSDTCSKSDLAVLSHIKMPRGKPRVCFKEKKVLRETLRRPRNYSLF